MPELMFAQPVDKYIQTKGSLQELANQKQAMEQRDKLFPVQEKAANLAVQASETEARKARLKDVSLAADYVLKQPPEQQGQELDKVIDFYENETGQDLSNFRGRTDLLPVLSEVGNPAKQEMALKSLYEQLNNASKLANESTLQSQKDAAAMQRAQIMAGARIAGAGGGDGKIANSYTIEDSKGNRFSATQVIRNGQSKMEYAGIGNDLPGPVGPIKNINKMGDTSQGAADIEIDAKRRKDMNSAEIEFHNTNLKDGLVAAKALPVLNRSMELLNSGMETGFTDAWKIKAKKAFGVESADEGELVYLLRKNVLQQLRPIFGAQFTAIEGGRLQDIEASENRSTETNAALLQETYDIAKLAAEIGMESADALGSKKAAEQIAKFGNLKLSGGANAKAPRQDLNPNAASDAQAEDINSIVSELLNGQ